jgi:hypothetical protein
MRRTRRYAEFFSDSKHGGERVALRAAQHRLKELKAELPPIMPRKNRLTRRNQTGVVGVTVAPLRVKGKNRPGLFFYVGGWKDKSGRSRRVYFSWQRYGKRKAFRMACFARTHETTDRDFIIARCTPTSLASSSDMVGDDVRDVPGFVPVPVDEHRHSVLLDPERKAAFRFHRWSLFELFSEPLGVLAGNLPEMAQQPEEKNPQVLVDA